LRVILKGNEKSWDEHLPCIKFANNRVVQKTTNVSHFEVVYDFNPTIPLHSLPLLDINSLFHKEGVFIYKFIKKYHEKVKDHIEKQTKICLIQQHREIEGRN